MSLIVWLLSQVALAYTGYSPTKDKWKQNQKTSRRNEQGRN